MTETKSKMSISNTVVSTVSTDVLPVLPPAKKEKADNEVVVDNEDDDDEDVAAVVEAVSKSAEAEAGADLVRDGGNGNGNVVVDDDGTPSGKRRFFPRVKHLLTPEWEFFLQGVLSSLEFSGAPLVAAASHKAGNPWYKAFHGVYGGVASDCSIPTGKNRYHKFKDKIVELWTAMEQVDSHPLKEIGIRQINSYRLACENKISNKDASPSTPKTPKTPAASGINNNNNTPGTTTAGSIKRPADLKITTTTANKRPNLGNPSQVPPQQWRHLDEAKALTNLPQPLQSLVHLRHLGNEVQSTEPQTQLVEDSYQRALSNFLESPLPKSTDTLMEMAESCLALWRCAKRLQKNPECKAILYMYHTVVQEYVQSLSSGGTQLVTV